MLTQSERDSLLDTLSEPQKEFIVHFMKRGKRTQFSNLIATWKVESKSEEEGAEDTASNWELKTAREGYIVINDKPTNTTKLHQVGCRYEEIKSVSRW